jgi:hypothetical protein
MEVSGQLHTLATLRLEKEPSKPIEQGAVWAPEPARMFRRKEKSSASCRNCTSYTSVNSVNLNLHLLGPQFQKSLLTDVINTEVHN